jgi:MOSC domain-containing protein YiiM
VVSADGRRRRLRGANARVVSGGGVRVGDAVRVEPGDRPA